MVFALISVCHHFCSVDLSSAVTCLRAEPWALGLFRRIVLEGFLKPSNGKSHIVSLLQRSGRLEFNKGSDAAKAHSGNGCSFSPKPSFSQEARAPPVSVFSLGSLCALSTWIPKASWEHCASGGPNPVVLKKLVHFDSQILIYLPKFVHLTSQIPVFLKQVRRLESQFVESCGKLAHFETQILFFLSWEICVPWVPNYFWVPDVLLGRFKSDIPFVLVFLA